MLFLSFCLGGNKHTLGQSVSINHCSYSSHKFNSMFRPFGRSDRFYYVNFYFKEDFILMAKTKKILEKKNWSNSFMLIGEAKINDYTYKLDAKAGQSDWIYNSLNLGV